MLSTVTGYKQLTQCVAEGISIELSSSEKCTQFLLSHLDCRFIIPFSHQELISTRNYFCYMPIVEHPTASD